MVAPGNLQFQRYLHLLQLINSSDYLRFCTQRPLTPTNAYKHTQQVFLDKFVRQRTKYSLFKDNKVLITVNNKQYEIFSQRVFCETRQTL